MQYEELIGLLERSSVFDWIWNDDQGIAVLKANLNISVRRATDLDEPEPVEEEWATKFPDPRAKMHRFELYFGATFIKDYLFASVNGGRALLPFPNVGTGQFIISPEQRAIADAVNPEGPLRDRYYLTYMERFTVVDVTDQTRRAGA